MSKIKVSVDPEIGLDLMELYLKTRREEIDSYFVLAEKKEFAQIKSLFHKIKGNAGSFGFPQLGLIARDIEAAAKVDDQTTILTRLADFKSCLENLEIEK